jgi:hypothetical protein
MTKKKDQYQVYHYNQFISITRCYLWNISIFTHFLMKGRMMHRLKKHEQLYQEYRVCK